MNMTPVPLTDQEKTGLNDKRSAHLKSRKQGKEMHISNQLVRFTDEALDEWKPGFIDSKDSTPDSYWIVNEKSDRRLRRNIRDIKPRHVLITKQRPQKTAPASHPGVLFEPHQNMPNMESQTPQPSSDGRRATTSPPSIPHRSIPELDRGSNKGINITGSNPSTKADPISQDFVSPKSDFVYKLVSFTS